MSDRGLVVGAGAFALLLLGGSAWWLFGAGSNGSKTAVVPSAPPPASSIPIASAPTPAASTAPVPPRRYWPSARLGVFDPKRFAPEAFLPTALADARTVWPDATLVWLSAVSVGADGFADLTTPFASTTAVSYAFRSPSTPDAGARCVHWVFVADKGAWSATDDDARLCAIPLSALAAPRRCTLAQAFARVAAGHPPALGVPTDVLRWTKVRTNDGLYHADWSANGFPLGPASTLSTSVPDDCPKP